VSEAFLELLEACRAAIKLLRGSGFTENTLTVTQLRTAIDMAEIEIGKEKEGNNGNQE